MNTATLAQCQARYDNASDPRLELDDDSDAIAAATDAIRDALTKGNPISTLANGTRYRLDEGDVCDELNQKTMKEIIAIGRSGDETEAGRLLLIEWARAIDKVAAENAEFRVEWERA